MHLAPTLTTAGVCSSTFASMGLPNSGTLKETIILVLLIAIISSSYYLGKKNINLYNFINLMYKINSIGIKG